MTNIARYKILSRIPRVEFTHISDIIGGAVFFKLQPPGKSGIYTGHSYRLIGRPV
jgi:hypothetical protein